MNNKKNILFWLIAAGTLLSTTSVFSQKKYSADKDPVRDNDIVIPEMLNTEVDLSLVNWFGQKLVQDVDCRNQNSNTPITDQDYIDRLAKLPTVMEMPYNQIVRSYINLYAERRKGQVSSMLGLANFYFPLFEEELAKKNMPIELKYLPIIESALNPTALSRAGASGLWQFMYSTGKIYDLNVDSFVDERRDPIKSTKAAVKYLKDLYDIYQDWHLAIAAYNCGPGNVNKAIRRANGQKDYWAIYNYLPRETRGYVPAFIAATYIMNYYQDHQICPNQTRLELVTDTVHVNQMMHFEQISQILAIPIEEVRALNPQYKIDIVPGNVSTQLLRLPMNAALAFHCNSNTICAYRPEEFLVNNRRTVEVSGGSRSESSGKQKVLTHRVKKGETISRIASRYGVSVADVKRWNKLKRNSLKKGQRLRIYKSTPQENTSLAQNKQDNSPSQVSGSLAEIVQKSTTDDNNAAVQQQQTTASNANTTKATTSKKATTTTAQSKKKSASYKVKKGDTLSTISRKTGVSVDKIKKANKISNSKIRVGQVLKIPKG